MPSALSHDPQITVPGASTDNAVVIFDGTGGTGFGNSTIVVDSGGNGRIGLATDTNLITLTNETVTVAGAITGVTALTVDNFNLNGNTLTATSGAVNITPAAGSAIVLDGAVNVDAGVVTGVTSFTVDNINIDGNTISSTAGTDLLITPLGGQQLILDGLIVIDNGVVTGATSITSTEFVGGGIGLTALNGTEVTSGTLPAARIAADSIVEAKLDVSNGPSNGLFLQAQSGEGGGLTWAAAGGAVTREGSQTTEASTTATSSTDLLSVSSMSIAALKPFYATASLRKTSGGSNVSISGYKLNTTTQAAAANTANNPERGWNASSANHAEDGGVWWWFGPRLTNYTSHAQGLAQCKQTATGDYQSTSSSQKLNRLTDTNPLITATVTDFVVQAFSGLSSYTTSCDECHVYSYGVS